MSPAPLPPFWTIAVFRLCFATRSAALWLRCNSRRTVNRQFSRSVWAARGAGADGVPEAAQELRDSPAPESTSRGYLGNEHGIYYIDPKTGPSFLSSPFTVTAATREIGSTNWRSE